MDFLTPGSIVPVLQSDKKKPKWLPLKMCGPPKLTIQFLASKDKFNYYGCGIQFSLYGIKYINLKFSLIPGLVVGWKCWQITVAYNGFEDEKFNRFALGY